MLGATAAGQRLLASIPMSLQGQERRFGPRPSTVRCSTESVHIAAPPRTGAWGQKPTSYLTPQTSMDARLASPVESHHPSPLNQHV
jgi:hypothetical protein